MRLVRSWPASPPPHPHVIDGAERNVNTDYDYTGLVDFDDDIIHLDWDMALHREDLARFAEECRNEPDRVRVAPYKIYADSRRSDARTDRGRTVWSMRRYNPDQQTTRHCTTDDTTCHLFGFGMVYLPRRVIADAGAMLKDDITFSQWLHLNRQEEVPICWQTRPVHLHYRIENVVA